MAAAKSPLTGTWGEANCGGTLSPAIKRSGFDGIFIKGMSQKPVIVNINGDQVDIEPCDSLWGLDTVETQQAIQSQTNEQVSVACIGQAGEKLSLISGIVNDGARIAARSGLGAVMGSKKLKALIIAGKQKTEVYQRDEVKALNKIINKWVKLQPPLPAGKIVKFAGVIMRWLPFQIALDGWFYKLLLKKWGTVGFNQIAIEMGDAPIKNWQGTHKDFGFSKSKAIASDLFIKEESRKYHCFACPIGCGGLYGGKDAIKAQHKPEYETIMAWSGMILNEDTKSLFEINELLNRSGMDSISAGATAAFAVECFEKGLLTREESDGLDLRWGSNRQVISLLKKMIAREGVGILLADGSFKAAQKIGKNAKDYSMHAGGQELAFHDTRYDPGLALHAVVDPSPGRHVKGAWQFYEMFRLWRVVPGYPRARKIFSRSIKYEEDGLIATKAAACSQFTQVLDGSGICLFGAFIGADRLRVFEMINAVTGWKKSAQDYLLIGKRILTLKQMFNAREKIALRHEINPRLLGIPPLKYGAAKNQQVPLDAWVTSYWKSMGWNEKTGEPTTETLQQLSLRGFVDQYQ